MSERKIIWQKWVNPLTGAGADEDISFDGLDDDQDGYRDSYDKHEDFLSQIRRPKMYRDNLKMGHIVAGPLGYLPIDEHGDPAVVYDFWMMHTNFDITPQVQHTASRVPGVESWNLHSRYRARVGFGKAFNRSDVMAAIQKALGCCSKTAVVQEMDCRNQTLDRLKKKLSLSAPSWAILEMDDGQFKSIRGQEEFVRQNVESLKALPNPPKIIVSWEK